MSAMMQASANPAPRSPKRARRITATQVHGALVMVTEGHGASRSKAEQRVTEWEVGPSPGYVAALVEVVQARAENEAATGARLLAAICLKNVIGRRWRPRRGNAVDDKEKDAVRAWLLNDAMQESDERVFAQLELCCRRCAKADWPATFRAAPQVYLASYARGSRSALRLFGAVVKELARKGLPRDRRVLKEDAAVLLPDVAQALKVASNPVKDLETVRILAKAATRLLHHAETASEQVYDVLLQLDALAVTDFLEAAPRLRRKLQTVVVPLSAWRRSPAFAQQYGAPFLQRAVAALGEPGLLPAGAVARLELCGDALGDPAFAAFAAAHGAALARWCLTHALPLQPAELDEHANDPDEYALRADDGWALAHDGEDVYDDADQYDADAAHAPDGARAVRAAAERCLLALLAVDADRALAKSLVAQAFGDDRRAAVQNAVAALAALPSDTYASSHASEGVHQCRAFFKEAEATLRAAGTSAAGLSDALPGVGDAVGQLWTSYFPALLAALRKYAKTDICVNAYRRRLLWLARCWARAIEASPRALTALAGACAADIGDEDAAVACAALDVCRRFAVHFPPSSLLLDAALKRASEFLDTSDDLAEAALRAASQACACASRAHAVVAADRVRDVAALGTRILDEGGAPTLVDACADCCRAALSAARASTQASQASVTACAFVALLLDDARDAELCAAPSAARLWLDALRTLPLDDHAACRAACRPALTLDKLCAPPRDLDLAMDVAQVAHCAAILGPERCEAAVLKCAARACAALAGEVSWRASGHVDRALEALLLVAPDIALEALCDGALVRLADDALDERTAASVAAQHFAVLCRACAHDPQRFAVILGEDRALSVYRAWLARKHVRGDSPTFDDAEAARGADVDGAACDVLAARAHIGALACLRLACSGDGQALLSDLDGALTLVNEAARRGPGTCVARSPRVADRASPEGEVPVDADDATMELPLDALCAWRAQNDWARTDLAALARSALEAVAGRVGPPAVQEALDACDAAVLGQLGLASS